MICGTSKRRGEDILFGRFRWNIISSNMNTVDRVRFETSPEASIDSSDGIERRPTTPHPHLSSSSRGFNFHSSEKRPHTDGCIGISLSTVYGLFPSFREMMQRTLKPLNCADSKPRRNGLASPRDENFDEYDLMNRIQSWKTQESRSREGPTPMSRKKSVQFQYPPITSVRLRPRTESDEIDQLYFAPDELDQIEDDRSDTKAADDIETLCVVSDSYDIDSVPGVTESSGSEETEPSQLSYICQRSASMSMSPSNSSGGRKKKKGIVRGVQILLREKSLG